MISLIYCHPGCFKSTVISFGRWCLKSWKRLGRVNVVILTELENGEEKCFDYLEHDGEDVQGAGSVQVEMGGVLKERMVVETVVVG